MQELLSAADRRQRSSALVAVHEGWSEAALRLIEYQTFSGTRAAADAGAALLVHASEVDDVALAAAVLRRCADPNVARASDKVTPLGAAAAHGSLHVLRHLLGSPGVAVDLTEEGG